jgi:thymidylate synthase ThyX
MPVWWGKNQSGMQAREEMALDKRGLAIAEWLNARRAAVDYAERMLELGVHKQIANRLLEPFQEMKTIVTATEWDNFYNLRRHPDAQPEIRVLAEAMWSAMQSSTPTPLRSGEWHLPYVLLSYEVGSVDLLKKLSTARCARVSYLTHDSKTPDPQKDEALHDRLQESGHFSPFEHIATPASGDTFSANLRGWMSYRYSMGV